MRDVGKSILIFLFVGCAFPLIGQNPQTDENDGAKAIRFLDARKLFKRQPTTTPKPTTPGQGTPLAKPVEQVGVEYRIQLTRDGQTTMVPSTFPFVEGDIIHIKCDLNEDSYVYILDRTFSPAVGSKGLTATAVRATPYKLLYPLGDTHKLPAGKDQIIPDDVTIQFDQDPGIEKVFLVISPKPLDVPGLVDSQRNNVSPSSSDAAGAAQMARLLAEFRNNTQVAEYKPGAKGLQAYKNTSAEPASYALTEDPTKPIVAVFSLQHIPRQTK